MKKLAAFLVAACLFVSSAFAATLIIEGPAERGEGPLPAGGGQFRVDVYAEGILDFAGFDMLFRFVDALGRPSGAFQIGTDSSSFFGGQAIYHNAEVFPQIFPVFTQTRQYVGFMLLGAADYSVDIAAKTLLLSATFDYSANASGRYMVMADPKYATVGDSHNKAIPCALQGGSFLVGTDDPPPACFWTLTVKSTGLSGVAIGGSHSGETDYTASVADGSFVSISAVRRVGDYELNCWRDNQGNPVSFVSPNVSFAGVSFVIRSDTALVAEYLPSFPGPHTLTVRSEGAAGVSITGTVPGTPDYTAQVDGGSTVNLIAPEQAGGMVFQRWKNQSGTTLSTNTIYAFPISGNSVVIVEYVSASSVYDLGRLIIEGPTDRGEPVLPAGGGTARIDIYGEHLAGFGGMQVELEFVNLYGTSALFLISTQGGNPLFNGLAVTFNDALFPGAFPFFNEGRTCVGFMAYSDIDIVEKTWLMSITCDYPSDAAGVYAVNAVPDTTVLAGGNGEIPCTVRSGLMTVEGELPQTFTLTVQSSGPADVPIGGTNAGITEYSIEIARGETVILTAPWQHDGWFFSQWRNASGSTISTTTDCSFVVSNNITVTAVYTSGIKQFYVSTTGNNENPGTSSSKPMASIQALLDRYPTIGTACTLNVASGTYRENVVLTAGHAGLAITGVSRPWQTVIDGGGLESCISLAGFTGSINRFTLRNGAATEGGGLRCEQSSPKLKNVIITGNQATSGGGVFCQDSSPVLENCTITANHADSGGGISSAGQSAPSIRNCIIWGNTADTGPQIAVSGAGAAGPTITYSDVEGGPSAIASDPAEAFTWGSGNIDADPLFADAQNGDYHLRSTLGRWDPQGSRWVTDAAGSPCIDAGDPASSYGTEPAPNGSRINMGAFGNTVEASYGFSMYTLDVRSTPSGAAITGDFAGTAPYTASVPYGSTITLVAPWQHNGLCLSAWYGPGGSRAYTAAYTVTIKGNTTLTVEYEAATEFYVAQMGSDDNSGTGFVKAMRSIQTLLDRYPNIGLGCTIYVAPGAYNESVHVGANHDGISIAGDGADVATLSAPEGSSSPCIRLTDVSLAMISGLYITGGGAGGIVCENSSPIIIACSITDNAGVQGAGICCIGNSAPVIGGNMIVDNTAELAGGGIWCDYGSTPTIDSNIIASNHAWFGAGVCASGGSQAVQDGAIVVNNIIFSNRGTEGGGIYCSAPMAVTRNLIACNRAARGAGVCVAGDAPVILDCVITGNTADNGGGIYCREDAASVVNCTITGNRATAMGYAFYADSGTRARFTSTIMWGNAPPNANEVSVNHSSPELSGPNPEFAWCCIAGGKWKILAALGCSFTWGEGNVSSDPRFVYPCLWADNGTPGTPLDDRFIPGNYRLASGSPCIDAAEPGDPPEEIDVAGEPRLVGDAVDIGAFECAGSALLFVDDDALLDPAPGDPAGSDPLEDGTPAHPFDAIQEAIDAAADSQVITVLDGTYRGEGNRDIDLRGKAVILRSQNGALNCTIDCGASPAEEHRGVIFASGESDQTVLHGFTVINAFIAATSGGAGILCEDSSPIIINCALRSNSAGYGGGLCILNGSPIIVNTTLHENSSAEQGGGIWCGGDSQAIITNNTLTHNSSSDEGGAIYDSSASMILSNAISGNSAQTYGGGITLLSSASSISRNVIVDNSAPIGGGIDCADFEDVLVNNLIARNTATISGGGVSCDATYASFISNTIACNAATTSGGGLYCRDSAILAVNCIIWGNTAASGTQIATQLGTGSLTVEHCAAEIAGNAVYSSGKPPVWGEGIVGDPLFVDPAAGDYHLLPSSPCIDAGINDVPVRTEMDIGGVDRLLDGNFDGTAIIDIGAFEYLPGDANYDGKINIMDLILIWGNVGKDPTSGALTQRADVNGDGVVNLEDMILARQRMMAR